MTTEDLENADKMLEKKYNDSKHRHEEVPEWANHDYDDDIPLWGDADITDIRKETENTDEWTNKFVKKLNKDDVEEESESSETYDDDSDDEPTQKFTQSDIQNLPNIL